MISVNWFFRDVCNGKKRTLFVIEFIILLIILIIPGLIGIGNGLSPSVQVVFSLELVMLIFMIISVILLHSLNRERVISGYYFNDVWGYFFIIPVISLYLIFTLLSHPNWSYFSPLDWQLSPFAVTAFIIMILIILVDFFLIYRYWKLKINFNLNPNELSRINKLLELYKDGIPISIDRIGVELKMKPAIVVQYLKEILKYNQSIGQLYELEGTFIKNNESSVLIDELIHSFDSKKSVKI